MALVTTRPKILRTEELKTSESPRNSGDDGAQFAKALVTILRELAGAQAVEGG